MMMQALRIPTITSMLRTENHIQDQARFADIISRAAHLWLATLLAVKMASPEQRMTPRRKTCLALA